MKSILLWISVIVLSGISGILYHLGGMGKDGATRYPWLPKWLWGKINGKVRDWGCPLLTILALWLFSKQATIVLNLRTVVIFTAVFLTSWGALSTYWKKGADCKWFNWFLHGTGCGLACLPLAWCGVAWWLIVARAVLLGATMTAVSEYSDNVLIEEGGRGGLVILTLPILFVAG